MSNRVFANLKYPPDYYAFQPGDAVLPGDGGYWHDMGDWDNMYLDRPMTIKVTAAGQAVAAVRDKGRNGFHLYQDTPSRRPLSWESGGVRGLDFIAANFHCMQTDIGGVALRNNHGWAIFESDLTNNFLRIWATSGAGVSDGVGPDSMVLSTGDAATFADLRALNLSFQVSFPGVGVSPRALYEYEVTTTPLMRIWQNNVLGGSDNSPTGTLNQFSANRLVVGALSSNGEASGASPGAFDGRIFQILHCGTIPSAGDQTKIEAWFDKWRW
jgi:hypothetical protein